MNRLVLISNLTSLVFAIGSLFLCYNGVGGWGWFMVLAVLCHTGIEVKK